jgi:hypothetical protein
VLFTYSFHTPWSRVILEKLTSFSISLEFPLILLNRTIRYPINKYPSPVAILSHLDPVQSPTSHSQCLHTYTNCGDVEGCTTNHQKINSQLECRILINCTYTLSVPVLYSVLYRTYIYIYTHTHTHIYIYDRTPTYTSLTCLSSNFWYPEVLLLFH